MKGPEEESEASNNHRSRVLLAWLPSQWAPPSSNLKTKNKTCLVPWCPQCHSWHSNRLHHASGTPRSHHFAPVPGAAQAWAATGVVTLSFCHLWEVSETSSEWRSWKKTWAKHAKNDWSFVPFLCQSALLLFQSLNKNGYCIASLWECFTADSHWLSRFLCLLLPRHLPVLPDRHRRSASMVCLG